MNCVSFTFMHVQYVPEFALIQPYWFTCQGECVSLTFMHVQYIPVFALI